GTCDQRKRGRAIWQDLIPALWRSYRSGAERLEARAREDDTYVLVGPDRGLNPPETTLLQPPVACRMPRALVTPTVIKHTPGPYRDVLEAAGFEVAYPTADLS